jgi:hypothetical protein
LPSPGIVLYATATCRKEAYNGLGDAAAVVA